MKGIAVLCVVFFLQSCSAQDPAAEERLRQNLFGKYNKEILPTTNTTNPPAVTLGLSVININDIDLKTQTLDLDGWIVYRWSDSRLTWDPSEYDGIKVLRVFANRLFVPDVTVYNSVTKKDNEWAHSSKTRTALVYNNGDVLWVPAASLQVYCNLDMTYYPYDEHTCSIVFGSWTYDGLTLDVQLDAKTEQSVDLSDMRNNTEWTIDSTSSNRTVKYYPCCKEPYPSVFFNLKLKRNSPIYQAATLLPIIAGLILALGSFMLSPISKGRQGLNGLNLLLFLITLYHLQNQLPSVGNDSPAIVMVCGSMILLLSLAIGWGAVTRSISNRMKNSQLPRMVQWLNNSWPTKVLMVSKGERLANMKDYYDRENEIGQGKDGETVAIVPENRTTMTNGWMIFFSLLDRIALVSFILIIITVAVSFAR